MLDILVALVHAGSVRTDHVVDIHSRVDIDRSALLTADQMGHIYI